MGRKNGRPRRLSVLGRGAAFGEVSLVMDVRRTTTVRAFAIFTISVSSNCSNNLSRNRIISLPWNSIDLDESRSVPSTTASFSS